MVPRRRSVSIHTLAYAAHEIIHVISRRTTGDGLLFGNNLIKDEYRREFDKLIKTDANFVKHAKDDFDSSKEFNVTAGISFIAITVAGLARMNENLSDAQTVFLLWARVHLPNWFTDRISDYGFPANMLQQVAAIEKSQFFDLLMQARRDARR